MTNGAKECLSCADQWKTVRWTKRFAKGLKRDIVVAGGLGELGNAMCGGRFAVARLL